MGFPTILGARVAVADLCSGSEQYGNASWAISQDMTKAGSRPGNRIGYIGGGINAYWARLSGVKIVADVNYIYDLNDDLPVTLKVDMRELKKFWAADSGTQARVLRAFAKAGATFAVADEIPAGAKLDGWTKIDDRTYARKLDYQQLK